MADTPKKSAKTKKPAAKVGELTTRGKEVVSRTPLANGQIDQTNWRRQLKDSRIRFDDKAKNVFLEYLAQTGLKQRACDAACISLMTVNRHLKNDPDFAEAHDEALGRYRDKFVAHAINDLAYKGTEIKKATTKGKVYTERVDYPIPLILAELRRVDHGFRDKQDVNIGVGGGVLVVSGPMSPEDWVADQAKKNEERNNPMLEDPFSRARLASLPPGAEKEIIDVEAVEVILPDRAQDVAARAAKRAEEVAILVAKAAGMKVIK